MDKLTRLYKLHQTLLSHRHPVSMKVIQERLECSRATAARAIDEMRLYFDAPLEYVREANGYAYVGDHEFQLPGLWLSERELLALLTLEQIVEEIGPGLLAEQLKPFSDRMRRLLAAQDIPLDSRLRRIVLGSVFKRPMSDQCFGQVAEATLRRRRLAIRYHSRERDSINDRTVSPQRLVWYRDTWYLEGWCHERNDLRTFALDRLQSVELADEPALDVAADVLKARFESSFGIYSGPPAAWAVLRFSQWQARWTKGQEWHSQQKVRELPDGRYELEVPYSDDGELVMHILAHMPHVEVVSPQVLRETVYQRLEAGLALNASPMPTPKNSPRTRTRLPHSGC